MFRVQATHGIETDAQGTADMGVSARQVGVWGCVVALVLLAASGCWHQDGGDAMHSGSSGSGGVTAANVGTLVRAWVTQTGAPSTSPVVYSGSVVSSAAGSTSGGKVTAFDAEDGSVRWSTSPVAPGQYFTFRTMTRSAAGLELPYNMVAAGGFLTLDPATGAQIAHDDGLHVKASTAVVARADATARVRSFSGSLGPFFATLIYGTHGVFLSFDSAVPITNPSIIGSHVIIGVGAVVQSYSLGACPAAGCAPEWTRTFASAVRTPTGIDADRVAVANSGGDFSVLDTASGAILWKGHTPAPTITVAAGPDGLYVGGSDGTLYAFARSGCGAAVCWPTWSASTGAGRSIIRQPMVADDVVYVGTDAGTVVAFPATCPSATCPSLWTGVVDDSHTGGVTGLAVDSGSIYATTSNGVLAAFRRPD